MRYLAITFLILVFLGYRLSSAQGHMGTLQEQAACRRDDDSTLPKAWGTTWWFSSASKNIGMS